MKRAATLLTLAALLLFVVAWTYEDCVEVGFDHPDCDQYTTTTYPTTTTGQETTTTAEITTTTAEVTTTTEGEQTTTTEPPTTTTVSIPFDSVPPATVPFIDTTTTQPITAETLPFTGMSVGGMVGLGVSLAAIGVLMLLGTRNRKAEG